MVPDLLVSHVRPMSEVARALSMHLPSRAVSLAAPNGHATSRHTEVWAISHEDAGGSVSLYMLRKVFLYGFVWVKAFLWFLYGKFHKIVCPLSDMQSPRTRGAGGEASLQNKIRKFPLPFGKGAGGWGKKFM